MTLRLIAGETRPPVSGERLVREFTDLLERRLPYVASDDAARDYLLRLHRAMCQTRPRTLVDAETTPIAGRDVVAELHALLAEQVPLLAYDDPAWASLDSLETLLSPFMLPSWAQ